QNLSLTVTLAQRWFHLFGNPVCARQDIRTYGRQMAGGGRDAGRVIRSCRKDAGSSLLMVRHRLASASHVSPPNTPLPAEPAGSFFWSRRATPLYARTKKGIMHAMVDPDSRHYCSRSPQGQRRRDA